MITIKIRIMNFARGIPLLNSGKNVQTLRLLPWIVLISGVFLQTAVGGIYAWSTFVPHLVNYHGLSRGETGLIFGVQVLLFAVTTVPAGRLLERFGPRLIASIGALLFGTGFILASFAGDSFPALLLSLGLTSGIGIGLVYVCPLTTGMKWFPKNRGLVTGAAVAGFGLGAILLSQVAEFFLIKEGMTVYEVFRIVGFSFGGLAFFSALFLSFPKEKERTRTRVESNNDKKLILSPIFLVIAFGMFAGTFSGLLVSAHLKPFLLFQGASESAAVLAISLFAIGNTTGRLLWGIIHDKIGSRRSVLFSLGCLVAALGFLAILATQPTTLLISPLIILIGFGFGGCFVIYVSAITNVFGVNQMPKLYPICFVGYGVAALISPAAGGWLIDRFDSYTQAFSLSAVLITLAILFAWMIDRRQWTRPEVVKAP